MSRRIALLTAFALLVSAAPALGQTEDAGDLPILSREVARGGSTTQAQDPIAPTAKTIDGLISDWTGTASRYGGTAVYSAGEYVYQDHLFDAHGPDDGRDADRMGRTGALEALFPEIYRIDALGQADLAGELGVPIPEQYRYDDTYGDSVGHKDSADLVELRVASSGEGSLDLLARTTTMNPGDRTALLVLADLGGDPAAREIPFNSGISSDSADLAIFLTGNSGTVVDLASNQVTTLPAGSVVTDPSGFDNALEARLPLTASGTIRLAAATGLAAEDGSGFAPLAIEMNDATPHANLANVAFRFDEPVRVWFDKFQALSLHAQTIDSFFTEIDAASLAGGATETFVPGPGYHDRIFLSDSTPGVARESGRNGLFQHYGVYLPTSYAGEPTPLQWWLHWRGGNAHSGGGIVPRVFKHFGENRDTIVVSPSGRGTGRWYVGTGHVDFLEVWNDVFETFSVDDDRVYVTGHSMGGWGSYLLSVLYPDRFAGAAPVAGPVTQGAWTGADFQGCDNFQADDYTPCYITANGSRPRDQHTRRLLENALHVPYAILHGTSDELVPYSGIARQAEQLTLNSQRYRFYTYPGYEHYSHPIMDQWSEAARYLHTFTRPENPAHVVYTRDVAFEKATEEVQSDQLPLNFDFDSAYWMSELTVAEGATAARFDGHSLAIPNEAHIVAPDTGPPAGTGTTGPYVLSGLQWIDSPAAAPPTTNGFELDLNGASAVRLDLARMGIDPSQEIDGVVTTTHALELRLDMGEQGGIYTMNLEPGSHNFIVLSGTSTSD